MGILLVILFLLTSSWLIFALCRHLLRRHVTRGWWVVFGGLVVLGVLFGIWCAFYCEYSVGTRFRIASFPIPIVFFHLEDGYWVDFPVPEFQAWSSVLANVVTITAVVTSPLWLALWRRKQDV